MLKFPVWPNRNASFPDTPFMFDDIYMVSCGTFQPGNIKCPRVCEMHCKANNESACRVCWKMGTCQTVQEISWSGATRSKTTTNLNPKPVICQNYQLDFHFAGVYWQWFLNLCYSSNLRKIIRLCFKIILEQTSDVCEYVSFVAQKTYRSAAGIRYKRYYL